MRILEMTIEVNPQGEVILQLPPDITVGLHRAVLVVDEQLIARKNRPPLNFPVDSYGNWPTESSPNRREEERL